MINNNGEHNMLGQWELDNRDRRTRHPDDARSKFERWVLAYGGSLAVSKAVGVHHITVATWIGRRGRPNIETTSKLLKLAKGELTIDDVIEGTRSS
jgi:hypothetical protein